MSDFLILPNDITRTASHLLNYRAFDTDEGLGATSDILDGANTKPCRTLAGTPGNNSMISIDCTTAESVEFFGIHGVKATVEHCVANSFAASFSILGDENSGFASPNDSLFNALSLGEKAKGPREQTTCVVATATGANRYWLLRSTAVSSGNFFQCQNWFLGRKLDLGRDPIRGDLPALRQGARDKRGRYNFSLTWQDISNAKREELIERVLQYKKSSPVFLYDGADKFFNGYRNIFAWVTGSQITSKPKAMNDISISFQEIV